MDARNPLHLMARKLCRKSVRLKTTGRATTMGAGAALMNELSKHLLVKGKRFRVTIDCDPDADRFVITREDFN